MRKGVKTKSDDDSCVDMKKKSVNNNGYIRNYGNFKK